MDNERERHISGEDMGIVQIDGLSKIYKSGFWGRQKKALDNLSLAIEKGETCGYLGPNGAGKTTTLKILLGLIRKDSGSVSILGHPIGDVSVKRKIGFLPEQPYFYDYLKGRELLEFYASFFGLSRSEKRRRIADLLEIVSLEGAEDMALRKYSKGMLQRIGIAQALINDPEIVFLDEPLSGLDPLGRKTVKEIILRLKGEGKTIFFCSHILPDVEMICDRVAILNKGRLVAVGNLYDLLAVETKGVDIEFKGITGEGLDRIKGMAGRCLEQSNVIQIMIEGEEETMSALRMIDHFGGKVISVTPHRKSLEEIFVSTLGIPQQGAVQ